MKKLYSGSCGETVAANFLIKKGYDIEAMNYHSRFGEIDIIAQNDEYLVFAEVKTRSSGAVSSPKEAVMRSKQKKIISTALYYLSGKSIQSQIRFDVIEVYTKSKLAFEVERIEHIENAFELGEGDYNAIF